jgi:hypothetical protein
MRIGTLVIIGGLFLGALFWPWLIVFAAAALIVAVVGLLTKGGKR